MADYNSTYTGAEVDAAVAKTQGIPSALDVTSAVNKALALEPANEINEAIAPAAASSGDVWTADGNGGAAWVAPSGGGSVYSHQLWIQVHINSITVGAFHFALITPDATPYTATNICEKLRAYYRNPDYSGMGLPAFIAGSSPDVIGIGQISFAGSALAYENWLCNVPSTITKYTSASSQKPTFLADYVIPM